MLVITDLNDNILGVWGGNNHTLANIYPNNPEMLQLLKEYWFEDDDDDLANYKDKYKIVGGQYVLKTAEELNPPPTKEQQIDSIKAQYQDVLDKLIITKQRMEMLGQPIDTIITAYQSKKAEMDVAIRGVQ